MLAGSAALRYADVASPEEFRERMRAWAGPFAASVQEALLPLKAHVKVWQLPYCLSDYSPRCPHVSMQRRCGLQCLESWSPCAAQEAPEGCRSSAYRNLT